MSCRCPIWAYGQTDGVTVRKALRTRVWREAEEEAGILSVGAPAPVDEILLARAVLAVHEQNVGAKFVYLVSVGRCIKIGIARDVTKRLKTIQTANSRDVRLCRVFSGGVDLEAKLHGMFSGQHRRGEWFARDRTVIEFIKRTEQLDCRCTTERCSQ